MIISETELKQILKLKGVKDTGFSPEELKLLIEYKTVELQGLINANIEEKQESQTVYKFRDDRISLAAYPVQGIESITLDNKELSDDDWVLDHSLGLVYFTRKLYGLLTVNYISCLDDDVIKTAIVPLLTDMILYDILNKKNNPNTGIVSNVKEGDVSVSYDTSTTLGNRIWSRIEELRARYSRTARVRLI